MHVILSCKNASDSIKNEGTRVTTCFPLEFYGFFFRHLRVANSPVHGQNWPNFELIRTIMVFLIISKNEEDPIKKEGARVFVTLYINVSDAQ